MEGALSMQDLDKLASMIGAYMVKQQPEEIEEEEDEYEEDYDYRAVKAEEDLHFHPDKFYYGINFRTMILDPSVFGRPWFIPISHRYVAKVQYCLQQARLFIKQNELERVEDLKKQIDGYRAKLLELERELAKAKGEAESSKALLAESLKWQSAGGAKNMAAESVGMEPIIEDHSTDQDRKKSGQFKSKGIGHAKLMSGLEKKMAAVAYSEAGCTCRDISILLGPAENSIRGYVSEMKKHWRYGSHTLNGKDDVYLQFDDDCGGEMLYLKDFSPELLEQRIGERLEDRRITA